MNGPLHGIKIVEISAAGPVALFGWMMADYGATVIRIDRPAHVAGRKDSVHVDNRAVLELDLKDPDHVDRVLDLVAQADVLVEGFRPGVMERMGLGPDTCLARNPKLVYARCTGWGQHGPLAADPGHDINYLALTGALAAIGTPEAPVVPLNIGADYGGGTMPLAIGVLSAIIAAQRSGRGQVIDAAMIDGSGVIVSMVYELYNRGLWHNERAVNFLDGAAPYYGVYRCSDGKFVAVGALEMKFRKALSILVDVPELGEPASSLPENWPALRRAVAERFATAPRDTWIERAADTEACCSPVLDITEAPHHPHNVARGNFVQGPEGYMPAPAPRFSATPVKRVEPPALDATLAAFAADGTAH
ncbi:Alpha-methylacyl-CoA racemase [Sphingobium chlorophenolicum L-1]|uniref:Alpha-methylacyl-CoA racemase n=1 Tax=Sphingobium chlorophenolicum L-1 TaxID=690566 RepID=F6F327_SPHCR|nr:CaiB/BaiF CoA-transferase family protein [Sphingobium chlorophenolicum]AEG50839.1 Alpha-methylacyl-CoA racemase [Sphingobium chlorophenolicum L-1]